MSGPEETIHLAIVHHLEHRAMPGVVWFHPPNGGSRHPIEAAKLKRMGVKSGVSDICGTLPNGHGTTFVLEIKAKGRKPTQPQRDHIGAISDAGGFAAWVDNIDDGLAYLEEWGVLKPDMSRRAAG